MTKVGIIGYGTMGKRYHKVLSNNSKFEIKKILRKKKKLEANYLQPLKKIFLIIR